MLRTRENALTSPLIAFRDSNMISVLLMKACKQRSRGAVKRFQFPADGLFLVGTLSAEAMMDARTFLVGSHALQVDEGDGLISSWG